MITRKYIKKHSSYEWVEALRLTEKSLNHSKKNNYKEGIEKGYLSTSSKQMIHFKLKIKRAFYL